MQLLQFDPNLSKRTLDCMTMTARSHQEYGVAWCDDRRRLGFGGVIGDEYAVGKIVSPFFLGWTNEDPGRQLPAIQVIERHVVMEQDQVDVYEAVRLAGKREAIEIVQEKGINRSRVEVLSQINRLRQVCCDPTNFTLNGQLSVKASKHRPPNGWRLWRYVRNWLRMVRRSSSLPSGIGCWAT
jgi:SNF2 family DNA or RNA helicase